MRLSDGSYYDTARHELITYDNTKPSPHNRTRTHINNAHISVLKNMTIEEICMLINHTTGPSDQHHLTWKRSPARRWREVKRALELEIQHEWVLSFDYEYHGKRSQADLEKYAEQNHYNQYCILYKKNKSCSSSKKTR